MIGAIAGAAIQAGSSIYGAIKSSQANKRATGLIKRMQDENRKWYEDAMNEDYLQRPDVMNILRKQRELLNEQYHRARATNVVAGGTDESLALQQQAANDTLGETTANIAAQSADYKESKENQFRERDAQLNQWQVNLLQNEASQIAQAAGQVGKAVGGLVAGGLGKTASTAAMPNITPDVDTVANEALAEAEANDKAAMEELIPKKNN